MRKIILLLAGALLCAGVGVSAGQQRKTPAAKQEKREVREQRRATRLAEYAQHIDSVVQSRNFQFNPQTMQRMPAGPVRQLLNPTFNLGIWSEGTVDICLPYIKGFTVPYYTTMLNYTIGNVQNYTTERTNDGWTVTFMTTLFSASDYTFTLEIFTNTGGANLTITNPWYNPVQYTGTISQLY